MRALAKRQRLTASPENTDTKPETDDEIIPQQISPAIPFADSTRLQALVDIALTLAPQPNSPNLEHPTRSSTPATVLDSPPPQPGPFYRPDLYQPPASPTHARLRATLELRELAREDITDPNTDPQPNTASQSNKHQQYKAHREANNIHIYDSSRSHQGSASQTEPRSQSNPHPNARSDARAQINAHSRTHAPVRAHPQPGARHQPGAHYQPNAHPSSQGFSHHPSRRRRHRHRDPVVQARADMAAFNDERAHRQTSSLVQSVSRHTERMQGVRPKVAPRLPHELLPDDEEIRARAAAIASGTHPVSLLHYLSSII